MAKIEIIDPTPVYSPAEDSWLLEECILKEDLKSMKCLDFGCGEGIQSIAMFKAGAKSVLAVDINKNALRVTLQKVGEYLQKKRKIEPKNVEDIFSTRESDLFSKVNEKFNFIAFNSPYVPSEKIKWKDLEGGENGRVVIDEFITEVPTHLPSGGVLLLLVSSLNNIESISKKLSDSGFSVKIVGKKKLFFEELNVIRAVKL
jgi:release factor glutamine methyltransferase